MARESADATVTSDLGSRSITMTAYPPPPAGGNTYILIRREQVDTATKDDIGANTTPVYPNAWLRLRRIGNTMVGYTGTNGVNWDVQGVQDTASWPDGPLNSHLLLGLAVASANGSKTTTAQFKDFGAVPSGKPVTIAVPLKSVTVNKGQTATFSVTVSGYDPYTAQWYTNGAPISGGTNFSFSGKLSYTTPPLSLTDDNTAFSIVVRNSAGAVTNANAVLHVVDDTTPPIVTVATTDNSSANVVFSEEISPESALDLSAYTLQGAPGVTVTAAMLSLNNRVAYLTLSEAVTSTNASITVAKIKDVVGNVGTSTVRLWPLLPADNIVANSYPSDRQGALASVTDGVVDDGWQTNGDKDHRPQFAGLIYTNVQTFNLIRFDLGLQNEYGGSFTETPNLYLLKNNVDTDTNGPDSDPINWQRVAAPLVSPNLFDANVDLNPSPASPIIFDLSALGPGERAAYGWAVGGVRGDNSGFIRISELRAYGQSGGTVEAPRPSLSVSRNSANSIVISWPTAATDFVLKSSPSLSSPVWTAVTDPKVVAGNNVTVTIVPSGGTQFYRLDK